MDDLISRLRAYPIPMCLEAADALEQVDERRRVIEGALARIMALVGSDAYAMSFQSLGQYRSALRNELKSELP